MKKIITYLLLFALLMGSLASFSFVSAYGMYYSGGSGTEEDPYLISTEDDIFELHYALKTDLSLWYTKYYYKLTNDIETNYDLYVDSCTDEYSTSSFQWANKNREYYKNRLVPIYWDLHGTATRHNPCVYSFEIRPDKNQYYNKYFSDYYAGGEGFPDNVYKSESFWNAAFTGVFDGNGYTVKLKNGGCFFGFIENEAIIKNLTVEGEDAYLAFCLDGTSIVANCLATDSNNASGIEHNYGIVADGITEDGFAYMVTDNSEVYIGALVEFGDTVVIPETIEGMPMVGIGRNAFNYKDIDIESLYIHSGIMKILPGAFGYKIYGPDIVTIYYDGTESMLLGSFSSYDYRGAFAEKYNVVYADSVPIEGFALKNGVNTITLKEGQSFRLEYEYYPEKAKGYLSYSVKNNSIVSVSYGLITAKNAGETTVTVTAESGVKYTFTVKVIGCVGIGIESLPAKIHYGLRQPFDATGLSIVNLYNDDSSVECTEYSLSSFNPLQRGVQTITVTSGSYKTSFEVFVSDALLGDIDLDGKVTGIDSNYMKRTMAGEMQVEEKTDRFFACDMNGDGVINALDSALLRRAIAG